MENKVFEELNSVLKGEQMAVEAYDRFIREVNDISLKKEFEKIQTDHKRHVDELGKHIKANGGQPKYSTGFSGTMASAMSTIKNIGDNEPIDILKQAYDGEDKGIWMAEELIKGDLDENSRELVKGMLSKDHEHLKTMANLISKYEMEK